VSPKRGEVWLADFELVEGHEQGGRRPALILSVDAFNASRAELVTVLPITSRARALRTRVTIRPPEANLSAVSYVVAEQPRTISSRRLGKRIGAVLPVTMDSVSDVVRVLLGL
jgi:mRNA interferase MazF